MNQPQVPTVLLPGAEVEDSIWPRNLIDASHATVNDESVSSGDQGRLWLALEFDGETQTYEFTFTIQAESRLTERLVCPSPGLGPFFWIIVGIVVLLVLAAAAGA